MSAARKADIAIVGAGIVGLAHALEAARRGLSAVLFERSPQARGASVRNFGMVWPIGQEPGTVHRRALRSREIWLQVAPRAGVWIEQTGSLHLAYRKDELAVLEEFSALAPNLGYQVELLTRQAVLARSPGTRPEGLLGGLWSPTEACVDPRQAIAQLPRFLAGEHSVELRFSTPVHAIDLPHIHTPQGVWEVERAVVCSGADFESLYPELYSQSGLTRCKLQMLRTAPQPDGWRLGPLLAAGLTLRHYAAFKKCLSLQALEERVARETPQFDRWGIHVMASQNGLGEIVVGDSHEYGLVLEPFDNEEIDRLILDYLRTFLRAPSLEIARRWHGVYAKHPEKAAFVAAPAPGVRVVNGLGGAGMSTSFGLAEQVFAAWD